MDHDIRALQRRLDRDPQDREARLFLDRARRRSWTPGPDLAAELARLAFEAHALRARRYLKRPINAAALLDHILIALPRSLAPYRPILARLRGELGAAVGADDLVEHRPFIAHAIDGELLPSLLELEAAPIRFALIEEFLNGNAELEDQGDYAWLQELIPLPRLAGTIAPDAVAREAVRELSPMLYRGIHSAWAPGPGPPALRGEPGVTPPLAGDEFRELFQALLVLFLGPSWTTFDTPYQWRACVSHLSLIQRGEDWFAFTVQLD